MRDPEERAAALALRDGGPAPAIEVVAELNHAANGISAGRGCVRTSSAASVELVATELDSLC